MQYLRGGSLEESLRQGPLPWPQAVETAAQVAEALDYAHGHGVVHRDIKPADIMFDEQDRAAVTDFGIAKAADEVRLTAAGISLGTPQYMAPEQAKGNPVDGRADLYALGVVLYEILCGRPPFEGQTAVSIAMKHMSEAPVPLRQMRGDVAEWLERIVLMALAKEPAERSLTGAEMARALRSQARVAPPPTNFVPRIKRRSPVGLAALAIVLAMVGVASLIAFMIVQGKGCSLSSAPPPPGVITSEMAGPSGARSFGAAGVVVADGSAVGASGSSGIAPTPVEKFVLPDSSMQLLGARDLAGNTNWELTLARNEIYGRHGRWFENDRIQRYFNSGSRDRASTAPNAFDESVLDASERKSTAFVRDYQYQTLGAPATHP